jgi:hypothetical protein
MPKSTAELQDWRARPEYNMRNDQSSLDLWNYLRGNSWGAMGAINRMPGVFDPSVYWSSPEGSSQPETIRSAVKPNSPQPGSMGLLSLLAAAQDPNNPLAGLLGKLQQQG